MKYKNLQSEKDDEIVVLTDEINKLKRELDIQRDELDRFKRSKLDLSRSTDSLSKISQKSDDETKGKDQETNKHMMMIFFVDILQNWVQIPKENVKKNGWKKHYAVLTKHRFLLYNSEKDQHAIISIDLKYVLTKEFLFLTSFIYLLVN